MPTLEQLMLLGVALAIGLLIGLERGWKMREMEEGRRIAGVRTYGLMGLAGGVVAMLSEDLGAVVLGLGFVALAIVVTAAYLASLKRNGDAGITSLVASLLTFGFGALAALGYVTAAASAAVITALLLGFKPVLHRWVSHLAGEELRAALKLLLISVVLLPILPDQGYGPWSALNPYEIWWMVVLVACISFVGYFAVKIAGTQKGIPFTGLFAGLASSTALTLHFARMARGRPSMVQLLGAGILLACGTMFPRMLLLASVISPQLFAPLLIPAAVMSVCVYVPSIWMWWTSSRALSKESTTIQNPLELKSALTFGALLAVIMLLAAALKDVWGDAGIFLLAAASGLADVDAITLSLSRMTGGELVATVAVVGIVIGSAVNSLVKAMLAFGIGGRALGVRAGIPLVVAAGAGMLSAWLLQR